ncbi:MAG: DUF2079 domain-containing protein [Chloroflexota bacterium]|nr:DUF2079 domain-containing protein [Dehalococcoidia bacterium]MDW8253939.1 DUF2079 domain-containing protein [Chloroflexota bacterium]
MSVFADFALALAVAGGLGVAGWLLAPWLRLPTWSIHLLPVLAAGWGALYAWLSVAKHDAFRTHAYDLGIYDQVIWNTSQGRLFENSIMHFLPHFLGDHFSLGLLLLAPIYWVWPDPRALLILQAFALPAAALPLGYLAARLLKCAAAGLALGVAYLLHPGNAFTALFDFHDIVFAPPLIALALRFLLLGRPGAFTASLLPILLIKEEMGLVVAAVGAWTLLFTRFKRTGLLVATTGAVTFVVVIFLLVPLFNPEGQYYYLRRYFDTGAPGGEAAVSVERFLQLIPGLFTAEKAAYVGHLTVPFALLPFAGLASLMALPTLGYHLLSPEFPFAFIEKHYSVLLLPFLAFGAAQALHRLGMRSPRLLAGGVTALLGASGAAYYLIAPGPPARSYDPERFAPNPRAPVIREAIALIPRDASLLAQTDLVPHVSQRRQIYMFPDAPVFAGADYVLLDLEGNKYPLSNPEDDYDRELQQFLLNPDFETIFDRDNILVLRRRVVPIAPTFPLEVNFARRIALDGADVTPTTLRAGETVTVTLWWRALIDVPQDVVLFIHLIGPDGERWTQLDKQPTEDWFGTSRWKAGRRFRVPYELTLPTTAPPGDYRIVVGLYDVNSQRRLGIVGGGNSVDLPAPLHVR